jgi:hypothetical protein
VVGKTRAGRAFTKAVSKHQSLERDLREVTVAEIKTKGWINLALGGGVVAGCCLLYSWTSNLVLNGKLQHATLDVKNLDKAVKRYYADHGQYPPDFQTLCARQSDGSPALLDPRTLIDPWGQPYIYETGTIGRRLFSSPPHIYSHGPPGEGKMISNWLLEEKE